MVQDMCNGKAKDEFFLSARSVKHEYPIIDI